MDSNNNNNNNTMTSTTSTTNKVLAKEIDMNLFTGITIFDDDYDDDEILSDDEEDSNKEKKDSKTHKMKLWFYDYYKDLAAYKTQREDRHDNFLISLEQDEENEDLTVDEKKQLEYEHFQKETSYLRLKRNLIRKEFEPLFIYTSYLNPPSQSTPQVKFKQGRSPNRRSGTFAAQGSLSPPSNISPADLVNNKKQNRQSTNLSPIQQQLYSQQSINTTTTTTPINNIPPISISNNNNNISDNSDINNSSSSSSNNNNNNNSTINNNNNNNEFNGGTVYFKTPVVKNEYVYSSSPGTITPPSSPREESDNNNNNSNNNNNNNNGFDRSNYRRTKSISSIIKRKDTSTTTTTGSDSINNSRSGTRASSGSFSSGTISREFQNFTPLKNLSVQKNKSYTMMFKLDHKAILEQTEKLLEEKEKDTRIAAEIGQSLLEKNEDLEEEMKLLKQRLTEQESLNESLKQFTQQVDKLRSENAYLSTQITTAKSENEALLVKEYELTNELNDQTYRLKDSPWKTKTIKQQKEEIEELKQMVESLQESQGKLKKNRDKLLSTNESLQTSVYDLKFQLDGKIDESEFEKLRQKVKSLRQQNKKLKIQFEQSQLELSPESRSMIKNPEIILKSAYNDLIKNEQLISSTPKITNLRVLSDAKNLLGRLEAEIMNVDDCSLISTLINFLDQDVNGTLNLNYNGTSNSNNLLEALKQQYTIEQQQQQQPSNAILSGLNDSIDSISSNSIPQSDTKSALYMLICIISINKYTKYDKNRFKEINNQDNELEIEKIKEEKIKLKLKIQELSKLIDELSEGLQSTKSHNKILQDQIDQLLLEQALSNNQQLSSSSSNILSMADELKASNIFERDYQQEIESIKTEMEQQIQQHSSELQVRENEISNIKNQFELKIIDLEQLLQERLNLIQEYLNRIEELDKNLGDRDSKLLDIEKSIQEKDLIIQDNVNMIKSIQEQLLEKEKEIQQLDQQLKDSQLTIKESQKQLENKDQHIKELNLKIQQFEITIKEKEDLISKQSQDIKELEINNNNIKNQLLKEKEDLIKEKDQLIKERDQLIESLESKDKQLNDKQEEFNLKITQFESNLNSIQLELKEKDESIHIKDEKIKELQESINQIKSQLSGNEMELKFKINQLMDKFNEMESISNQRLQDIKEKDQLLLDKENQYQILQIELDKIKLSTNQEKDTLSIKLKELESSLSTITNDHNQCSSIKDIEVNKSITFIKESIEYQYNNLLNQFQERTIIYNDKFKQLENQSKESIIEKCKQVEELINKVYQLQGQVKLLESTIEQLKLQHNQDQEKSETLIIELLDKKEELDSMVNENQQLKTQVDDLRIKMEEKNRKHQVLKRELSMQIDMLASVEQQKKAEQEEKEKKRLLQEQINKIILPTQEKDYYIEEELPLIQYINSVESLSNDPHISNLYPMDPSKHIIHSFYNGVLLGKLVNFAREGTIDERVLNINPSNNIEIDQNLNLVFNSAKAIGCVLPSTISPSTLKSDPKEMVNLLYELVRVSITSTININTYPTLLVLKESNEDLKHFVVQSASKILLRWFMHHLELDKTKFTLEQLASNPSNLIKLFTKIDKQLQQQLPSNQPDQSNKLIEEYQWILDQSKSNFNIFQWLNLESIQNKNSKLLFLFLASVFKSHKGIGIKEPETKEIEKQQKLVQLVNLDIEGTREERAFCMWMNSLNIKPYVNNLQQDLQDGLVILQMFDKIKPGSVNWSKVNMNPSNAYMALENCNYGISIGKQQLRFSLVGIGGKDIHEGNRKLTLALIWQACKYHFISLLTNLRVSMQNDQPFTETDIIGWANKIVAKHGKTSCISGFKDQSIGDGKFLIDLLDSIESVVNYSIVKNGDTFEEKKLNAQYIINVARKIGCCIFVVWEDLVEVKPKMILTFISTLMCFEYEKNNKQLLESNNNDNNNLDNQNLNNNNNYNNNNNSNNNNNNNSNNNNIDNSNNSNIDNSNNQLNNIDNSNSNNNIDNQNNSNNNTDNQNNNNNNNNIEI